MVKRNSLIKKRNNAMNKRKSKKNRMNSKLKGGSPRPTAMPSRPMSVISSGAIGTLELNPETTVHLKGFAGGLDKDPPGYDNAKRKLFKDLHELKSKEQLETLVWDGDEYGENSFTHLIPEINNIFPEIRLVAFAKGDHLNAYTDGYGPNEGRLANWKPFDLFITWVTCANELLWDELGSFALATTGARNVLLVGGGDTVVTEYVRCLLQIEVSGVRCEQPVLFSNYPFTRKEGEPGFLIDPDKIEAKISSLRPKSQFKVRVV